MILKCMCTHTQRGKKIKNVAHGYHKQAKQLKTFLSCANIMANKPMK